MIVFVLVFSFVPLYEVSYTVNVDYQETENYYEDEPYEVTETYTEAIPLSYDATRQ